MGARDRRATEAALLRARWRCRRTLLRLPQTRMSHHRRRPPGERSTKSQRHESLAQRRRRRWSCSARKWASDPAHRRASLVERVADLGHAESRGTGAPAQLVVVKAVAQHAVQARDLGAAGCRARVRALGDGADQLPAAHGRSGARDPGGSGAARSGPIPLPASHARSLGAGRRTSRWRTRRRAHSGRRARRWCRGSRSCPCNHIRWIDKLPHRGVRSA